MIRLAVALTAFALLSSHTHAATVTIPEGTELSMKFDDALSSSSNVTGDKFAISLDDIVTLPDGTVLRDTYHGVGVITSAHRKRMAGQGGEIKVKYDYLRIGNTQVHLRGDRTSQGNNAAGTTVALVVLIGPLGLIKHGHDVEIRSGQHFSAFVDKDTVVTLPDPPGTPQPQALQPTTAAATPPPTPIASTPPGN